MRKDLMEMCILRKDPRYPVRKGFEVNIFADLKSVFDRLVGIFRRRK
jgi:hypothetical protein